MVPVQFKRLVREFLKAEAILRAKVRIFFQKRKFKKMLLIKNDGHMGLYKPKKSWVGCHHSLLVYDASKLSTVYVVKLPVLGLQRAPENSDFPPSV